MFTRKLFVLILIAGTFSGSYGQVVIGKVKAESTGTAIAFANIYINGTSTGTISDQDGSFRLDITKFRSMPLTISALGYNSTTVTDFDTDTEIIVLLKPRIYELDEVIVHDKSLINKRRSNLKLFKAILLGETSNSTHCRILNEEDITFNYSENDTLKAYARKPLLIDNKALGYKVTYFLDRFVYNKKNQSLFFSGNIIFNEDSEGNKIRRIIYENRRRDAYLGSRMHFFRSLWADRLEDNGFAIRDTANREIPYSLLVTQKDSVYKWLSGFTPLGICYDSPTPHSAIILTTGIASFDRYGYFDPFGIQWQGAMGQERLADWLPYDYEYNDK